MCAWSWWATTGENSSTLYAELLEDLVAVLGDAESRWGLLAVALVGALENNDTKARLATARRVLKESFEDLRTSPGYDVMTYWDAVPEALQAVHAAAALTAWTLERPPSLATLRSLDAALVAATAGNNSPRRLATLRRVQSLLSREEEEEENANEDDDVLAESALSELRPSEPSLVTTLEVRRWRAFRAWRSVADVFQGHGHRFVPVECRGTQRLVRACEFPRDAYLAQHRLFDQIPALAPFVGAAPDALARCAWIARGASRTPRHADPHDNLVVQVLGSKRWRLWPSAGEATFDLAPGDVLFVPANCPHAVDAADGFFGDTIAVNYWFDLAGCCRRRQDERRSTRCEATRGGAPSSASSVAVERRVALQETVVVVEHPRKKQKHDDST
mmetsp:Transcript_22223/g.68415  ORF Transcript_22223/g.68415 Transcript_22223/m.68415 type:complete len:389 (+) Transcript_22223:1103-2269(+)